MGIKVVLYLLIALYLYLIEKLLKILSIKGFRKMEEFFEKIKL